MPLKWLPATLRWSNFARLPNSVGIDPSNPLKPRSRLVRDVQRPMVLGIVPTKDAFLIEKSRRLVR